MNEKAGSVSAPFAGALVAVIFLAGMMSVWNRTPAPDPYVAAAAAAAAPALPDGTPKYCLSGQSSTQQSLSQQCMRGCEYTVAQGRTPSGETLNVEKYPTTPMTAAQAAQLPPGIVRYYTFAGDRVSTCTGLGKVSIYNAITTTPAPYEATQLPPPEVRATYPMGTDVPTAPSSAGTAAGYDPLNPPKVTASPLSDPASQYDPLHPPAVTAQPLPDALGKYPLSAVPQNGTGWDVSNCYTSGANVGACAIKLNPNVGEIAPTPSAPSSPYAAPRTTVPTVTGSPQNSGSIVSSEAPSTGVAPSAVNSANPSSIPAPTVGQTMCSGAFPGSFSPCTAGQLQSASLPPAGLDPASEAEMQQRIDATPPTAPSASELATQQKYEQAITDYNQAHPDNPQKIIPLTPSQATVVPQATSVAPPSAPIAPVVPQAAPAPSAAAPALPAAPYQAPTWTGAPVYKNASFDTPFPGVTDWTKLTNA